MFESHNTSQIQSGHFILIKSITILSLASRLKSFIPCLAVHVFHDIVKHENREHAVQPIYFVFINHSQTLKNHIRLYTCHVEH